MTVKLVIFDCDGVLVDSERIAHRVVAEALNRLGYPITVEESIRTFTGISRQKSQQLFWKKYGIDICDTFWDREQQRVLEAFETELTALNTNILEKLTQEKVTICVASSSERSRVIKSLKVTGQFNYLEEKAIFTSEQVKHGKPAPDLFLFAAEQIGVAPQNCIVIEDSAAGIEAARAADMAVIGFLGGSHTQFPWYQEKIKSYKIPIAHDSTELGSILKTKLQI